MSILTADTSDNDMHGGIEKEEVGENSGLYQHDSAGCNYREKANDIHASNDVQNHIPWSGQGLLKDTHPGSLPVEQAGNQMVCEFVRQVQHLFKSRQRSWWNVARWLFSMKQRGCLVEEKTKDGKVKSKQGETGAAVLVERGR